MLGAIISGGEGTAAEKMKAMTRGGDYGGEVAGGDWRGDGSGAGEGLAAEIGLLR